MVKPALGGRSAHYKKQSKFAGSRRQMRGAIVRLLVGRKGGLTAAGIAKKMGKERGVVRGVLQELAREGLLGKRRGVYRIE
jgi:Mn-dependent DtxR family transcriptional regulator